MEKQDLEAGEPRSTREIVERMSPMEQADIVRLSRIELVLSEFARKNPGKVSHLNGIVQYDWDNMLYVYYDPKVGFRESTYGPQDYQELLHDFKIWKTDVTNFFSKLFPAEVYGYPNSRDPLLLKLAGQVRTATLLKPGEGDAQHALKALTEHYKRYAKGCLQMVKEEKHFPPYSVGYPRNFIKAQRYAALAGISLSELESKKILTEYFKRSRSWCLKELQESPQDALDRMNNYGLPIADADDFLGERHSQVLIDLAKRALPEAEKVMRKNANEWFDRDLGKSGFEYWSEKVRRYAEIAGIDRSEEIARLSERVEEGMKPLGLRLLGKFRKSRKNK